MHRAGYRADDLWNAEDVSAALLLSSLRIAAGIFSRILLSNPEKKASLVKRKNGAVLWCLSFVPAFELR